MLGRPRSPFWLALLPLALFTLGACGSDDEAATAASTQTTETLTTESLTSETPTSVEPATGEDTSAEPVTGETTTTEPTTAEPTVADGAPSFDELDGVEDSPLAASIFTEAELADTLGGEWAISSRLDAGEPAEAGPDLCGESLPGFPDGISVDGGRDDGEVQMSQQIFLTPTPEWVEIFRLLATCEDAPAITGPVELEIVPVTISGVDDAVAISAFEADVDRPHSVVIALLSPNHTMLVSVEAERAELLDIDAIAALVERAVGRSN